MRPFLSLSFALAAAAALQVSVMPFIMAVMIAASGLLVTLLRRQRALAEPGVVAA